MRAGRGLDAGTELVFSYVQPVETGSYQETHIFLSHWGFTYRYALSKPVDHYANGNITQRRTVSESYQALSERPVVKGKAIDSLDKASGRPVLEIQKSGHMNEFVLIVSIVMSSHKFEVIHFGVGA
ncbi:hypothetical protein CTA2_2733 [Colletotrichum tanaceti]|uniref:Uncharacterized protein n=1 Tax=Colletotrichum tanaceti TaxID=1306861 RepID=A0A4U6X5Z0_9PEZI|nr:hypothetical protein CTA2_2733 [Colletotrichum tanaceti]TKW48817.1 hypothetical protein CTA1_1493 [Colletotrichum tanaceti]